MLLRLHEWGARHAPPVVCLHGVTGHGRRFRRLAEERLERSFRVLAPDLRGHGFSEWEPPWTIATHAADVLDTVAAAGVERAAWLGHSFGGRLILELAALAPERLERAVLLDPAIDLLPHVGFDLAEDHRRERVFDSVEHAIRSRLDGNPATPRPFVEEEAREHLVAAPDGRFRWRYCQSAVVSAYGELCTPAPAPETLRVPTLLVHAGEIDRVHVEADVNEARPGDVLERLAHRPLDAEAVDVAHREDLGVEAAEELALARVERPYADERDALRVDRRERPAVPREAVPGQAERCGERHAVDVAARARVGTVQVGVGVDPQHAAGAAHLRQAAEGADRDRVVAAEDERQV